MSTHRTGAVAATVREARHAIAEADPGYPGGHLTDVVDVDGQTVELLHRGGGAFRLTAGSKLSNGSQERTDPLTVNGVDYAAAAEMEQRDGTWRVADWRNVAGSDSAGPMWHVHRPNSFNAPPTDAAARKLSSAILPVLAAKAAAACPNFGERQNAAAEHADRGHAHLFAWKATRVLDDVLSDFDRKDT